MLWLCLHFPRLPLSASGPDVENVAVVDQRGARRWLITAACGCDVGIPLAGALALVPHLKVQVRRPDAEQASLKSLAYWACRFGQPVTTAIQDLAEPGRTPRALLWIEVGRSLKLFGGLEMLLAAVCSELPELGHSAQIGIAPSRSAAALLAVAGRSDPVMAIADLEPRLADLPINLLNWRGETLDALSGIGLKRLADLFVLPRDAFTLRFGADHRHALDQLLGRASEPCTEVVPPEIFHRRFELSSEVEDVERLQFPLKRMCLELQAYLRSRDCGLCSVTLAVGHAGARETRIHASFVDSHRDGQRVFHALRERLERDGLPLAARDLVLMAEDFAEANIPQPDLFDPRAGQAQAWGAAIERIRARLGETRAWTPQATEDHRPEHATRRTLLPGADSFSSTCNLRPPLLLAEPWPMPPPELEPGMAFERIESGWWDGHDIRRDYTTVNIGGGRAWVFREVRTQRWYLHGWWS